MSLTNSGIWGKIKRVKRFSGGGRIVNICQICKTENDVDSKFCKNCGSEIVIDTSEADVENKDVSSNLENMLLNEEVLKQNKVKDLFLLIKNKVKNSIFFRSKKNIVTTAIVIVLIFGIGVLWKTGVVSNAIANGIYTDMNASQITYDEAKDKLNILDKFGDIQWAYNKCDNLNNSQCSYRYAIELQDKKDYKTAIFEYEKVIEEDLNYENAKKSIEACKAILSSEAYTMAVAYEGSLDWYNAIENYSYVISTDANYTTAQAKIVELNKKLLDSTLLDLWEYKVENDFDSALELIAKTERYTQSDELTNYKEHFEKQKEIAGIVKFDYNHGPFTLYERYSSGRVMNSTYVETFNIIEAEIAHNGDLYITCEVTGIVSGSDYCDFDIKCYNEKGFITKTVNLFASVADGEAFKTVDELFIPADTVKIEFAADQW